MMNRSLIILFFSLIGLTFGCSTYTYSPKYDYGYLYDADQKIISPEFKVFHHSKDSSTLYFEIDSEDILYEKLKNDTNSFAKILMKYKLFSDDNLKNIADSGSLSFVNYGSNSKARYLQALAKIKMPENEDYWLQLRFRDNNKDINVINSVLVDKRGNNNHQYYLLKSKDRILFNQSIPFNAEVTLIKSPSVLENNFIYENSGKSFNMTPPPFVVSYEDNIAFNIDSVSSFEFVNNEYTFKSLNSLNRFKPVNDTTAGFNYFYTYNNDFPQITGINEFIHPIRYISTSKEYKLVNAAVDSKKAVDAFWLKIGKDEERAKKIIKEYYKRVESANTHFTSFKEGWKTDKGIIWIVYGVPTTITKTDFKETWTYGDANNILSVRFIFYRKENNLSTNDYELVRNSDYKNNWYRAVDLWRQGKIY